MIKYRTTVTNSTRNEIHLHSSKHALGTINPYFDIIPDGQWHTVYINLAAWGLTDIENLTQLRFDLLNGAPKGSTIDVAWVAFFETDADGAAYKETSVDLFNVTEISGDIKTRVGLENAAYNATGETDSRGLPMLYLGAFNAGSYDLSQYTKVIITYTMDARGTTEGLYNSAAEKTFALKASDGTVLARGTYTLPSANWKWTTMEIDIASLSYNGSVYVTLDQFLVGTTVMFKNVTFIS